MKCLLFVGLFTSAMLSPPPPRSYLPAPTYTTKQPETTTIFTSITPTITETVFDFKTSYAQVVKTRTQTQVSNVDVINTSWARTTVTVQQTSTSRRIAPVPGLDITTAVKTVLTEVSIATEEVPVRSTEVFRNTVTDFVTRTYTSQINSIITHSKCILEVVTVPKLVNEVITETAPHFVTHYFTQTLTVTSVVTLSVPTTSIGYY